MTRREIRAFLSKYLDDEGKSYEVLTEFRRYNQELVDNDRDKILDFFFNIYNFSDNMSFKDFEKSKDGETIFELKTLIDLDDFEDCMGLLFASGILMDDLFIRVNIMAYLKNDNKYLIRDLGLSDNIQEEDYLAYLDKYVLPIHRFKVNQSVLDQQTLNNDKKEQTKKSYTDEELKDILVYWFNKSSLARSFVNFFIGILDERLNDVLNYVVTTEAAGIDGQNSLVLNILSKTHGDLLDQISKNFSKLSEEDLKEFENAKETFIENIKKEMQEKNRHL